jgi:hypothetical protein
MKWLITNYSFAYHLVLGVPSSPSRDDATEQPSIKSVTYLGVTGYGVTAILELIKNKTPFIG